MRGNALKKPLPSATEESKITGSIGKDIDQLAEIRDQLAELEEQKKKLTEKKTALEERLLESMKNQGLDKASGTKGTVSRSESDVPRVTDWDAFAAYLYRHKAIHLLERRPATAAWREECAARKGKLVPGTEAFTKVSLNFRSIK